MTQESIDERRKRLLGIPSDTEDVATRRERLTGTTEDVDARRTRLVGTQEPSFSPSGQPLQPLSPEDIQSRGRSGFIDATLGGVGRLFDAIAAPGAGTIAEVSGNLQGPQQFLLPPFLQQAVQFINSGIPESFTQALQEERQRVPGTIQHFPVVSNARAFARTREDFPLAQRLALEVAGDPLNVPITKLARAGVGAAIGAAQSLRATAPEIVSRTSEEVVQQLLTREIRQVPELLPSPENVVVEGQNFTTQELIESGKINRSVGEFLDITASGENELSMTLRGLRNRIDRDPSSLQNDTIADIVLRHTDLAESELNNIPRVVDALGQASEAAATRSRNASLRAQDARNLEKADAIERGLKNIGRGISRQEGLPTIGQAQFLPTQIRRGLPESLRPGAAPSVVDDVPVERTFTTVQEKLVAFVDDATPIRESADEAKRVALGKRVAIGRRQREQEPDILLRQRQFTRSLSGELPGARDFEPTFGFTDDEQRALFQMIEDFFPDVAKNQTDFLLSDTNKALDTILLGEVPQPAELRKLESVFGPDVIKALRGKRSLKRRVKEEAKDLINFPRALKTAYDVSAPLRQGLMLAVGHPRRFTQATVDMFKALAKESNALAVTDYIVKHENLPASRSSGLFLAERIGDTGNLNAAEEAFMSRWAEKIPGIKQSQRAYTTFLNKLRFDVWNDQYQRWFTEFAPNELGISAAESTRRLNEVAERSRQWADFVNKASGRGPLGSLEKYKDLMNLGFFAPRLVSSRITLPFTLATHNKIRGLIAKDLAAAVAGIGGVISLANLSGQVDVEADPRSTDFGKIRLGPARVDLMAGFQPLIRYTAQIGSGQRKSTGTGNINDLDFRERAKVGGTFFRSKLSPQAQFVFDGVTGTTFIGEEATPTRLGVNLFAPLSPLDILEGYQQNGLLGASIAATSLLGTSVQTYRTVNDAAIDNFGVQYQELWPYERNVARGLWQLKRATEPTGDFARLEELDLAQQQDLADIASGFLIKRDENGTEVSRRRLRRRDRVNQYFRVIASYASARREVALQAFGQQQAGEEFVPDSPDPQKAALGEYFKALDDAKISDALFDSDGFNRQVALLERGWTQSQRQYVAANTHQTDVPAALLRILPSRTRRRIRRSIMARDEQDKRRDSATPAPEPEVPDIIDIPTESIDERRRRLIGG